MAYACFHRKVKHFKWLFLRHESSIVNRDLGQYRRMKIKKGLQRNNVAFYEFIFVILWERQNFTSQGV